MKVGLPSRLLPVADQFNGDFIGIPASSTQWNMQLLAT